MKEILYIKYLLFRRDLERSLWNVFHSRPVTLNPERRRFLKLAGVGAAGLAITTLGADKLIRGKQIDKLGNLVLKKGKKLVFFNRKGKEVLEIG